MANSRLLGGRFLYGWPKYSWLVVFAASYSLMVSSGFAFYAQSIFLDTLVRTYDFRVSDISAGSTVFFFSSGITGILVSNLIQRYDIRWVMTFGALIYIAALYFLPLANTLPRIFAFFICLGIGFSCISVLPVTTLIARWFVKNRAFMLAITQSGLSIGGMLITPIMARSFAEHGISATQSWSLIGPAVAILPLIIFLIRPDPESMGLAPDGHQADPMSSPSNTGMPFKDAIRTRFFIFMSLSSILAMVAQVGGIAHIFRLATERADLETATITVSVMALSSFSIRLIVGRFMDNTRLHITALSVYIVQALSMFGFAFVSGAPQVLLATAVFGGSIGLILMIQPLLLAKAFGLAEFPRLLSFSQFFIMFGVAAGPIILGASYDFLGGYHIGYIILGSISTLSCLTLFLAGAPESVAEQNTQHILD